MEDVETFEHYMKEAMYSVSDIFSSEDKGWVNLSLSSAAGVNVLPADKRIEAVNKARYYYTLDPLAHRSVSLMTDYAFGAGLVRNIDEDNKDTQKVIDAFWNAPANQAVLSPLGQRKNSDKVLVEGEIFFALFLGTNGQAVIRRIDPLEITEIITDPNDVENVKFYKRDWSDTQGQEHTAFYPSFTKHLEKKTENVPGVDADKIQDAPVYHLPLNTLGQRGNSYLLPALDWIKLYRQFLSSRVAIMLALARFAWNVEVEGGAAAVAAAKAMLDQKLPDAGSMSITNKGLKLTPIKTDSGAANAYEDGRQIKLMISAATGWPEQYFGDISIGNLATAKTVELPVLKMVQSYRAVWKGCYEAIDNLVLAHAGVPEGQWYVDRDFDDIAPEDAQALGETISLLTQAFPEFLASPDVQGRALGAMGINDTPEVLDALKRKESNPEVALAKALKQFREIIKEANNG